MNKKEAVDLARHLNDKSTGVTYVPRKMTWLIKSEKTHWLFSRFRARSEKWYCRGSDGSAVFKQK